LNFGAEPILRVEAGFAAAAFINLESPISDHVRVTEISGAADLLAGEVLTLDVFEL